MTTAISKERGVLKGTLAAAAATAVLVGGFGAFSVWTDAESEDHGSLTTGHLSINEFEGAWTDQDSQEVTDITAYVPSPGDVLTYSGTFEAEVTGSDIEADLTVTHSGSDVTTPLVISKKIDGVSNDTRTVTIPEGSHNAADGEHTFEVVVTFPGAATDAQDTTYDLGQIDVSLAQVLKVNDNGYTP